MRAARRRRLGFIALACLVLTVLGCSCVDAGRVRIAKQAIPPIGTPSDSGATLTVQILVVARMAVIDPPLPAPRVEVGAHSVVRVRSEGGRVDSLLADSTGRAVFTRMPGGNADIWADPAGVALPIRQIVTSNKSLRTHIPRGGSKLDTLWLGVTRRGNLYR